jgi:cellobiose epimerase
MTVPALLALPILGTYLSCKSRTDSQPDSSRAPVETNRDSIAAHMRQALNLEFERWYPKCVDTTCGGYFSDLNADWELDGPQRKMIVTQARHVWSASNAALFYPDSAAFLNVAEHGVRWLRTTMWDHEMGGFYDLVDRGGTPIPENGEIIKRAYGNSFAIYGLAAYARATQDPAALELAQAGFRWLERHSYDPQYGGYFQFMKRDGTPFLEGYAESPPKDQNSTIHLLESFTELYRIWPNDTLRARLASLHRLVRDTITNDPGYMTLFFGRDWTPVSYRDSSADVRERNYEFDHVSFGHDVETAYLLLEASEALGMHNDTTTLRTAKTMVDHALRYGWDEKLGGFFDGGYYVAAADRPSIIRDTKEWWSQAEALNSLLMMSDLFPADAMQYYDRFCAQWHYCKGYVIDMERGGWYWGGVDRVPQHRTGPKGTIWKGNYHTSRALINCIRRLAR